jgi:hypothetical protein
MSALEIFQHVKEVDCYPNISIAYRIGRKKLFKVETIEELFEVYNESTEVKWFGNIMH